jgi:hypothetical protein
VKDQPVPRYQQPDPELRRLSDDELYARLAPLTLNDWAYKHIKEELDRRQNVRSWWTDMRAWIAVVISLFALGISAAALLHGVTNSAQGDARGTEAEPQ